MLGTLNGVNPDDVTIDVQSDKSFVVRGIDAAAIGYLCSRECHHAPRTHPDQGRSLEDAYMAITRDEVEYQTAGLAHV